MLARQVAAAGFVLDFIVHVLDRAGFLPVPREQPPPVPRQIANHRMMMAVRAVGEEHPLRLEQTQSDIAQGLAILLFSRFAGNEIDFRPLPQGAVGFPLIGLPLGVRHLGEGGGQLHAALGADGKTNAAPRFPGAVRVPEPVQQAVLVAGGVAAKIALVNIFRQRGKGQLRAGERLLPGGHIAVAKLVGQHQIGFRPDRYHRLVASSAFIVRLRRRFVTLEKSSRPGPPWRCARPFAARRRAGRCAAPPRLAPPAIPLPARCWAR